VLCRHRHETAHSTEVELRTVLCLGIARRGLDRPHLGWLH
jgi:hypothetical protein